METELAAAAEQGLTCRCSRSKNSWAKEEEGRVLVFLFFLLIRNMFII